jgi:D-alanyl-D-alanine carboxypeptidase
MHDSHFANPHGLDAPDHYSSAHDLTMAARFAYRHYPIFESLSRATSWTVRAGDRTYDVHNLNRLLGLYEGADGVKIGYTEGAGRTIVGSATRNGHRVFVGLMNTSDTAADAGALLDWAFANFSWPVAAPTAAAATSAP